MDTKHYENIMNKYFKTGKIGKIKPYNLEHAKQIAYRIVMKAQG